MGQDLPAEFWEKLETESEIGTVDSLPYIKLVEGSLVAMSVPKSDGSWGSFQSLQIAPEFALPSGLGIKKAPALILMSIFLPESLQRQGIGTRVIETLEKRAHKEAKIMGIGPIESEAMQNLCVKLNFTGCAPFSCYKRN